MWKLEWVVNGIVKETILVNKPRSVANWKKKQLVESGNYTYGLLMVSRMK